MINQQPSRRDGTASGSSEGVGSAAGAGPVPQLALSPPEGLRQEIRAVDEQLMQRIEKLPKEAGWALITAGVIGVIAPGIVGVPFPGSRRFCAHSRRATNAVAPGRPQTAEVGPFGPAADRSLHR